MKKLSLMILVGFVAFSCAKEPVTPDNGQTKGGISIKFNSGEFDQVATRATAESALKGVTVLQYVNGKLKTIIPLEDKLFSEAVTLDGLVSMPSATMKEVSDGRGGVKLVLNENGQENMLVFLGNYKVSNNGNAFALPLESTYADLQAHTIKLTTAAALSGLEYTPMTGFYFDGITEGVTNQINASLSRSLAKINFTLNTDNFKVNGKTPSVVVNKIELCDVPTEITLFNANRPALPVDGANGVWSSAQTPYPAVADFATLDMTMNQTTGNKSLNFIGYMPENARGSFSAITSNLDKKPATISNAPGLTYILVDLTFTTTEGVIKNAVYKIYLGGNAAGDMNILGNAQYNVTTYLYGANEAADTRITVTPLFDPTIVTGFPATPQENANSYIINGDVANNTFFLPLTQARIGWSYISTSLADATKSAAFDALITGNDWEIVTLWRTWGAGDATSNVHGVKTHGNGQTLDGDAKDYFATLTFPAGIPAGNNAVVALKQISTGKVFWSWHLWFTDYNPNTVVSGAGTPKVETTAGEIHQYFGQSFTSSGYNKGKYIMDRNFGATHTGGTINAQPATTADAVKTYGMMYQWGRKDPFTPSVTGATALPAAAMTIYDATGTRITGTGNDVDGFPKVSNISLENRLAEATQNPMNYYTSTSDWTLKDDALWLRSSKTVFDPCPAGWRVPSGTGAAEYNPWAGLSDNIYSSTTNNSLASAGVSVFEWLDVVAAGADGRMYDRSILPANNDVSGVKAWYPTAGTRMNSSGAYTNVGNYAYVWASAVSGTLASCLTFNSGYVYPSNNQTRAFGFSVRCVQE